MPIVFVHGVNNRAGREYDTRSALITKYCEEHLKQLAFSGAPLKSTIPVFPYWGGDAAKFRWDNASLPSGTFDSLGSENVDVSFRPLVAALVQRLSVGEITSEPLICLARKDFVEAVETLSAILLDASVPGTPEDKASFIVAAQRYALDRTKTRTPAALTNDQQWVQWLGSVVAPPQGAVQGLGTFGDIGNALTAGAQLLKGAVVGAGEQLVDRTGNFVSSLLVAWGREPLNDTIGRFFGDIFVYLDSRGKKDSPGLIPSIVLRAIRDATTKSPNEPLVLIGHSLGGVILYDLLTSFIPDQAVAAFVTVGSQVGFFEEMKLYRASDTSIVKPQHVKRPPSVNCWVNAFDPVDIFSYVCSPIFNDVKDFQYDGHTHTLRAHGAYLEQERFFVRLRDRLAACG